MTRLLEEAVARAARLPDPQQDALAARLLADLDAEQAWDQVLASTTEDDLDRLVAFARAQAPEAVPTDDWLRRCEPDGEAA